MRQIIELAWAIALACALGWLVNHAMADAIVMMRSPDHIPLRIAPDGPVNDGWLV